jgi:hypothetical protein
MANTYTTKLGLAKPANGDVDWHIPINDNWDKIDTDLDKALKISGTTIDADKDWDGKNITNVGSLGAASIQTTTYTLVADPHAPCCFQDNSSVPATKTASPVPAGRSGTVYVDYNIIASPNAPGTVWLTLNGVEVPGSRHTIVSGAFDQIVTVAPGDTIGLRSSGSGGNTPYNSLFEIRAYMFLQYSAQHNW